MKRVRERSIAVVGAGRWGANHVRVWDDLHVLHRVCDSNPARLRAVSRACADVIVSSRLEDVLSDDQVAGVVLATPAATHAALAVECLRAGKHVLVEKPLALDQVGAQAAVRVAQQQGAILMVGHVMEFHPALRALERMVTDGELGRVQYIYSHRLNLGQIRVEENALWSFAPHDVAMILRLLRRMPDTATSHGGAYLNHQIADVTLTQLQFGDAVQAHIFVSWLHPFKEHRFVVVGERQMAVFDDTRDWPEKLLLYPHRVDWIPGEMPVAHRAEPVRANLEPAEPLRVECEEFLRCIEEGLVPETDGENGLRVLAVLEAAQRSLQDHNSAQPIMVALSDRATHSRVGAGPT